MPVISTADWQHSSETLPIPIVKDPCGNRLSHLQRDGRLLSLARRFYRRTIF